MKGVVYVYMVILLIMFVMIFLYIIFSYPLALTTSMIVPIINNTPDSAVKTNALEQITNIGLVWKYWPILLIVGIVLWGLIASQKKEPMYEGYGG